MRKLGSLLLPVLLFSGFIACVSGAAKAQDQSQNQSQDQSSVQATAQATDQSADQTQTQAQDQTGDQASDQTQDQTTDPPSRVARISYMQGSVSFQVSGAQDWVDADPNRPLTTGDNLWADQNSRAEFHIGSTAVRMSDQTGISILTLDDRTAQLQLPQGTIEIHLRNHEPGDAFEIDTANVSLTMVTAGEYVISTDANGSATTVIVREGQIQATGGGQEWNLGAEQQYTFSGTDQSVTYNAQAAPGFDDFENWCQNRDQTENSSASAQYVSRDVDGVYDLDEYGAWDSEPDYGEVWFPQGVAVDWAPYRFGHWVFIAPWGWTWVESEPWGFAPFHYGRWVVVGARWGWVPGPLVVRPVYAPAVVGFVGGGRFSLSVSFGGGPAGVGWFPLGPRDVYVPAYRASPRYVQTLNVTNSRVVTITSINNVYNNYHTNANVANVRYTYENNARAVTVVSRDTFVNARPVAGAMVRVAPQQLAQARVVASDRIRPVPASYISSQARPVQARPAIAFADRPAVVRLTPATPANRVPVYTNDSRPFNQEPARSNTAASDNGFRHFQPPSHNNAQPQTNQPQGNNRQDQSQQSQQTQKSAVRYAPPAKANDKMYDVHPPLNQKPAAQPRQSHAAPKASRSHKK